MAEYERLEPTTGEEPHLVRMKLTALGNVAQNPAIMVMLLIPDLGEGEEMDPEAAQLPLFFPVPVPDISAQMYFLRMKRQAEHGRTHEGLEDAYLRSTGIKPLAVTIREHPSGFQTMVSYSDREGRLGQMQARLHKAILFALTRGVPILVEEVLLIRIGKTVKLNFVNAEGDHQPDVAPAAISFHIKRGDKPEDLDKRLTSELLGELDEQERAELTELALEYEGYEWAQLFKDIQEEQEKDSDGDE